MQFPWSKPAALGVNKHGEIRHVEKMWSFLFDYQYLEYAWSCASWPRVEYTELLLLSCRTSCCSCCCCCCCSGLQTYSTVHHKIPQKREQLGQNNTPKTTHHTVCDKIHIILETKVADSHFDQVQLFLCPNFNQIYS